MGSLQLKCEPRTPIIWFRNVTAELIHLVVLEKINYTLNMAGRLIVPKKRTMFGCNTQPFQLAMKKLI
jgi:hypothetical protein